MCRPGRKRIYLGCRLKEKDIRTVISRLCPIVTLLIQPTRGYDIGIAKTSKDFAAFLRVALQKLRVAIGSI
jgi:hypothetical protein